MAHLCLPIKKAKWQHHHRGGCQKGCWHLSKPKGLGRGLTLPSLAKRVRQCPGTFRVFLKVFQQLLVHVSLLKGVQRCRANLAARKTFTGTQAEGEKCTEVPKEECPMESQRKGFCGIKQPSNALVRSHPGQSPDPQ